MTGKKIEPKASDANTAKVHDETGDSREVTLAKLAVEPCMTAALVSVSFPHVFGDTDVTVTHAALLEKARRVHSGNMREVESTLVAQAAALNSIFTDLARRAAKQEYLAQFEAFLKLSLRAQNQSRMTLETLATIKNPPVVFAKQANIANNQQVNNGEAVPVAHADEIGNPQSELSRLTHDGQSLDFGTPAQTSRGNPAVATVEKIDGT